MNAAAFVAVIGAGPAGLMAAETLSRQGVAVEVFDAMPSVGRKFLMAGKGGLNLTHAEDFEHFVARYGARAEWLRALLTDFGAAELRAWSHELGVDTFVGSSGRVFPREMKAAPLLRAWLHRLREAGVRFHARHRWLGWADDGALRFAGPAGETRVRPAATVLALGGGSWPQLGSDGAWIAPLTARGVAVAPLLPANCGFEAAWSAHFQERFAGTPLKTVAARCGSTGTWRRGEAMIAASGIEGGLIYALSAALRDELLTHGSAQLQIDLLPDTPQAKVAAELAHPRGARSLSTHLKTRLGIDGVKAGLLRECLDKDAFNDPAQLATALKALPVRLTATRPLAEAISSAGGVRIEEVDARLMLHALPGVFCAGEMLDWEAPTGGYLLTACFATGRAAGLGAAGWLTPPRPSAAA